MPRRRTYKSAPAEIVKEKPTKRARVESHVVVPILFSLALGFAVGLLLWWLKSEHAVTVGIGVFVVVMVLFLLNYMPSLLERETVSSGEDDDEYLAEQTVTLEVQFKDGDKLRALKFLEVPSGVERSAIVRWAKAALIGGSLGVNTWGKKKMGFTRHQYDNWMKELVSKGLVEEAGKGRALTRREGIPTMQQLVKDWDIDE